MKIFRFYRNQGSWYIDLPDVLESGGKLEDLEMLAGADILLDILSHGDSMILGMSTSPLEKETGNMVHGSEGNYDVTLNITSRVNPVIIFWCPIIEKICGEYPKIIHFKKLSNEEFKALDTTFVSGPLTERTE